MHESTTGSDGFIQSKKSRIYLLLSVIVSILWLLGRTLDIYRLAPVGAAFEAIWLPVIAAICLLTILSIFYWVKDKFNIRSLYLYSLFLIILTILFSIFYK